MAYSGDPGNSELDAVRFWLQDTGASPLLSDVEIQYFVEYAAGYSSDPILLAAELCAAIQAKYAGETSITGDGVTYSGEQLQAKYSQLATTLRQTWQRLNGNQGAPVMGQPLPFWQTDPLQPRPLFRIGQNDSLYSLGELTADPCSGDDPLAVGDYYDEGVLG